MIDFKRDLLGWYTGPTRYARHTAHAGSRAQAGQVGAPAAGAAAGGDAAAAPVVRDLPWRKTSDPYAIWVSETMLQQTRATTAIPYWERFMRALPTVMSLAEAPESQVLALWSGLGYYRRARLLHAAAKRVVSAHGARLPSEVEALVALDGVGTYTAGAIASIAFKRRVAAVDGNVVRVLTRAFAIEDTVESARGKARVREAADALAAIDEGDAGDWTQALMELGALVCTPRQPRCASCPIRAHCLAFARGPEFAAGLPRKAPKREPTPMHRVALVLAAAGPGPSGGDGAAAGAVLLAQRRSDAPFGGLWEPPMAPAGQSARAAARRLAERLGVDLRDLRNAGDVIHVLSHRRMYVQVWRGSCAGQKTFRLPGKTYVAIELVPYGEIPTRAHAALTRKVLDMANARSNQLF